MPDTISPSFVTGLGQIDHRISALAVPDEAFDANGNWSQTYTLLAGDGGAAHGRLSLARQAKSPGATLLVDWRKASGVGASGPTHWRVSGTVRTAGPDIGDDLFWQSDAVRHAGFYDTPGAAVAGTQGSTDGRFSGRTLQIANAKRATPTEHKPVAAALVGWQLFDVVQRLPRQVGQETAFTLVDQFQLVKPGQSLTYRGALRTAVGGGDRTLHRFDLLGVATVPATFWVDDQSGRLLAVVSGLEAYVLGELPRGGGRVQARRAKNKAADEL